MDDWSNEIHTIVIAFILRYLIKQYWATKIPQDELSACWHSEGVKCKNYLIDNKPQKVFLIFYKYFFSYFFLSRNWTHRNAFIRMSPVCSLNAMPKYFVDCNLFAKTLNWTVVEGNRRNGIRTEIQFPLRIEFSAKNSTRWSHRQCLPDITIKVVIFLWRTEYFNWRINRLTFWGEAENGKSAAISKDVAGKIHEKRTTWNEEIEIE